MWRPSWRSVRPPQTESQASPGSRRDRLAKLLALVTVVCLGLAFILAKDTQFLMPGPLASAHGTIKNCSACHTQSGSGKLSWIHRLVGGDPLADSKACLTCHKMPDTAFNAHGASADVLKQSTERLTKIVAGSPAPISAQAQSMAFPTGEMVAHGLPCATCHQEHQGVNFKLNKISNEQCRSCHVVKFDSFDGHHPKFDDYPFKRRTRIIYDHAGHFSKHFPEVAKKDPAKRIPATCSTCHNSRDDKRIMALAPFEQTCSACHLDQITGKERASGPKGVAFLSLPGIDLQTLKKKNASIGEWPDASEAALTPFMKVMISRNERGRALIKTVDSLNLQDLAGASDDQIKAVTDLMWEIKKLFHTMILGKASDVFGDFTIGGGLKLSANLVTDLTASIPRDVLVSAQQQWLPNLAAEMVNRPGTSDQERSSWAAVTTESNLAGSASHETPSNTKANGRASRPEGAGKLDTANPKPENGEEALSSGRLNSARTETKLNRSESHEGPTGANARQADKLDPPACIVRVFGQCLMSDGQKDDAEAAQPTVGKLPPAMRAGLKGAGQAAESETAGAKTEAASTKSDNAKATLAADKRPHAKAADQSDDLLFPTEEELREIKAHNNGIEKPAEPEGATRRPDATNGRPDDAPSADAASKAEPSTNAAAIPQTPAAPVVSVESNMDPENWADYGGWYRQDYGIFYRPTGHKDKFIYSWLFLTGPQAPKGDASPAAAVFDLLSNKDAQGSCTKCHSVDDIQGKGRVVNFSQPSAETKPKSFTKFTHEPHFSTLENRGCLTCHSLQKGPYLKSYEQGNPQNFVSNFGAVKKDLCQTCHTSSMARQDCLLCHKYHVNGVITPIMKTKIPTP
jgi:hypothetical protein